MCIAHLGKIMEKTVNLTIRISPKLKREAEEACAYLDSTLSSTIRKTLNDIVRHHHKTRAQDTYYERMFMEGDLAQEAQQALLKEHGLVDQAEMVKSNGPLASPMLKDLIRNRPPSLVTHSDDEELHTNLMTRKERREYERQKKKGTLAGKIEQSILFAKHETSDVLKMLIDKEKKGFLTKKERDQKQALLRAGVIVSD
ncbi:hypothetical protein A7981_06535 [Methylovorus sp. MM2]|nr:hypothetical protein A7981_06535 [Methylovorus sp. MM2]